jgi:hypothetical protein
MQIAKPFVLLTIVSLLPLSACAGKAQTVTTTTQTIECAEPEPYYEPGQERCTEVRRETTVVTETEPGCHGAVSCSFGLVGSLVSLPFRIAGEVLDTVF